jgi:hypothetical protein
MRNRRSRKKSDMTRHKDAITEIIDYLLAQDFGIKTFAEKFLYSDRKESFTKFYTDHAQEQVEQFLSQLFYIYFESSFSTLFRIVKSLDMKKFACAFIIKRIYTNEGENLTNFGFFFIRVIAKIGGIRAQ